MAEKHQEYFEMCVKPELERIVERYRKSSKKQRKNMLDSTDYFIETLASHGAREYLMKFRRILTEID